MIDHAIHRTSSHARTHARTHAHARIRTHTHTPSHGTTTLSHQQGGGEFKRTARGVWQGIAFRQARREELVLVLTRIKPQQRLRSISLSEAPIFRIWRSYSTFHSRPCPRRHPQLCVYWPASCHLWSQMRQPSSLAGCDSHLMVRLCWPHSRKKRIPQMLLQAYRPCIAWTEEDLVRPCPFECL